MKRIDWGMVAEYACRAIAVLWGVLLVYLCVTTLDFPIKQLPRYPY